MKKFVLALTILIASLSGLAAQGYYFGIKGGGTIGIQQWNNYERDLLFSYHGIAFIESIAEENSFSLFAQLGYHNRGSATRTRPFTFIDPQTGGERNFNRTTTNYIFRNVALSLGGKQKFDMASGNSKYYYMIGVRGEYTIDTNFDEFETLNRVYFGYFPSDQFVRKWNAGLIVGGGLEIPLNDRVSGVIELTINPDFTRQYVQFPIPNVVNPFNPGQSRTLGETIIRNTSVELSVGFSFLREVEYID